MSIDYADIANGAAEAIAEAGGPIVLIQEIAGEYDPATGTGEARTKKFTGVGARLNYSLGVVDGSSILRGDVRMLIGATGGMPKPLPGNHLEYMGERYEVIDCDVTQPAGVAVLYDVQARK
jgi:hypothetical protein